HQLLLGAVVDVSFESSSRFVLGSDDPLTRRSQVLEVGSELLGEPNVSQDQTRLGREVVKELSLGGPQWVVRPLGHGQRAEELAVVPNLDDLGHLLEGRKLPVVYRERLVDPSRFPPGGGGPQLMSHSKPHPGPAGPRS